MNSLRSPPAYGITLGAAARTLLRRGRSVIPVNSPALDRPRRFLIPFWDYRGEGALFGRSVARRIVDSLSSQALPNPQLGLPRGSAARTLRRRTERRFAVFAGAPHPHLGLPRGERCSDAPSRDGA